MINDIKSTTKKMKREHCDFYANKVPHNSQRCICSIITNSHSYLIVKPRIYCRYAENKCYCSWPSKVTDTRSTTFVSEFASFQIYLHLHSFIHKNIHIYTHSTEYCLPYNIIHTYTLYIHTQLYIIKANIVKVGICKKALCCLDWRLSLKSGSILWV